MTREEALEKLNELAGGEGQDEVYERGEVAADGEPRLVYDAVKSNDQGYFSPLGKTTLQVGIELPAVKHADAALQERIGQCYLKLASIQKQLEKEPLAYDTTPELKAEYEEKLARLEGLKDAPEGSMEKVFYQTYQNWMETRENYHSPLFGCEASALHEGLAAAVAKADHYQHPKLPEKMLAEYDPFLVSTDSLSAEQLAATVAGNMWQRLADQRASAEAVSTPKLVYSTVTDDLVDDQLEFFSSATVPMQYMTSWSGAVSLRTGIGKTSRIKPLNIWRTFMIVSLTLVRWMRPIERILERLKRRTQTTFTCLPLLPAVSILLRTKSRMS